MSKIWVIKNIIFKKSNEILDLSSGKNVMQMDLKKSIIKKTIIFVDKFTCT